MPHEEIRERGRRKDEHRPRGGRGKLRLFVAAYPPGDWAERACGVVRGMGECLPPHRVVAPEQVHLTLLFIGSVDPSRVDGIAESVERSASGVGAFPRNGKESRLIAVETDAPAPLLEVVRRLGRRLAVNARPDPADRYLPHLTVCRFRKAVRGVEVDEPAPDGLGAFGVGEIRLVRSVLLPDGAEHRDVGRFGLG